MTLSGTDYISAILDAKLAGKQECASFFRSVAGYRNCVTSCLLMSRERFFFLVLYRETLTYCIFLPPYIANSRVLLPFSMHSVPVFCHSGFQDALLGQPRADVLLNGARPPKDSDRRYATHSLMPGKIYSVAFRARCPAVGVWACQVRGEEGVILRAPTELHDPAGSRRRTTKSLLAKH